MTDALVEAVARALLRQDCPWVDAWPKHAFRPEALAAEQEAAMHRARAAIAAIQENGHVIVPARDGANLITGHSPLDLSDIEPIGEGAIYIDGLTLDEAGRLLKVQT
jgi:hypothetical protein